MLMIRKSPVHLAGFTQASRVSALPVRSSLRSRYTSTKSSSPDNEIALPRWPSTNSGAPVRCAEMSLPDVSGVIRTGCRMLCSAQSQMNPPCVAGFARMMSQNSRKLPRLLPIACAYSPKISGLVVDLACSANRSGDG